MGKYRRDENRIVSQASQRDSRRGGECIDFQPWIYDPQRRNFSAVRSSPTLLSSSFISLHRFSLSLSLSLFISIFSSFFLGKIVFFDVDRHTDRAAWNQDNKQPFDFGRGSGTDWKREKSERKQRQREKEREQSGTKNMEEMGGKKWPG